MMDESVRRPREVIEIGCEVELISHPSRRIGIHVVGSDEQNVPFFGCLRPCRKHRKREEQEQSDKESIASLHDVSNLQKSLEPDVWLYQSSRTLE